MSCVCAFQYGAVQSRHSILSLPLVFQSCSIDVFRLRARTVGKLLMISRLKNSRQAVSIGRWRSGLPPDVIN